MTTLTSGVLAQALLRGLGNIEAIEVEHPGIFSDSDEVSTYAATLGSLRAALQIEGVDEELLGRLDKQFRRLVRMIQGAADAKKPPERHPKVMRIIYPVAIRQAPYVLAIGDTIEKIDNLISREISEDIFRNAAATTRRAAISLFADTDTALAQMDAILDRGSPVVRTK